MLCCSARLVVPLRQEARPHLLNHLSLRRSWSQVRLHGSSTKHDLKANRSKLGILKRSKARDTTTAESLEVQNESPENKPFTVAVREATAARDWHRALRVYNDAPARSPILCGAMVYAALVCRQFQSGADIYGEMCEETAMQVTVPVHVVAIQLFAKLGRHSEASRIWGQISKDGIAQDYVEAAYLAIIDARASQGDVEGAAALMGELATRAIPNVVHYGAFLKACARASDSKRAWRCLAVMRKRKVKIDVPIYTSAFVALKNSSLEDVLRLASGMADEDFRPDEILLEAHLQALLGAKLGAFRSLDRLQSVDAARRRAAFQVLRSPFYSHVQLSTSVRYVSDALEH